MNITLTSHSEHLLEQQLARGVYRSPEEVIENALKALAEKQSRFHLGHSRKSAADAVADILELRKGVRLGDLRIKDIIHEGHKY